MSNCIAFEVPMGTAEAACALIGYCLGSGNVALARRFYKLTAAIALCEVAILSSAMFLGSHYIAKFYSTDLGVQDMSTMMLKVASFGFLFDGM